MDEIAISPHPLRRFTEILGTEQVAQFTARLEQARRSMAGRTLWHANSTAEGGGVAELLQSVLGYPLECEIPVRWLVIDAGERFFELTKRLHHRLHGSPGDHGSLGEAERRTYESALASDAERLARLVRPGDPVVLHDPQTLGMAPALAHAGAHVVWSCHIGADEPNDCTRDAWRFLAPYAAHTEYQVFSRPQYAWQNLNPSHVVTIPPCIDAFSTKNQHLDDPTVAAILSAAGLVPDGRATVPPSFTRHDGTIGRVTSRATMIQDVALPPAGRVVTQISRWDPLKDHAGVIRGFCEHGPQARDVHLVLAGPDPGSIADDPEAEQTLAELRTARDALEPACRRRVHIACLPMQDTDENAAIVNALQRRADVVAQKSLAEGFGLTVAEAMWKAQPTVASRVGGIQDQIEPDVSGLLVEPADLTGFGTAVTALLEDRHAAASLGAAAQARVRKEYLAPRYLDRYLRLLLQLPVNRSR